MWDYLKKHEAFIVAALAEQGDRDWAALGRYHRRQIAYLQHERMIHLLVTLFFGLFTLLMVLASLFVPRLEVAALVVLMLGLLVPYVAHYFRLENGVQRLYEYANELDRRAGLTDNKP
ncbi:MAG: hypothetical protein MUF51_00665 [Vicinamibacteria bacterium]|jgi:Ca2+/Na+ antiporter|nr:hypothetical protein [Vicinamibacteria bacterium]